MRLRKRRLRWRLVVTLALLCPAASGAQTPPMEVDFAHEIVPLLKARCAECHTNGKSKGGVSFDTRAALLKSKAVVPGKSGASALSLARSSTGSIASVVAAGSRAFDALGR